MEEICKMLSEDITESFQETEKATGLAARYPSREESVSAELAQRHAILAEMKRQHTTLTRLHINTVVIYFPIPLADSHLSQG
ncbi:hypothetical protein J6590_091774 [Homalodisca vitripennis]|nr:hypothetical protein J6590_091774 [Homalodisca vitripennis]